MSNSLVFHTGGAPTRSIAFSTCQDDNQSRSGGIRGSETFTRLKGPFTPSQWMELEHQALIYKHIVANVPVPSNLLVLSRGEPSTHMDQPRHVPPIIWAGVLPI